MYIKLLLVIFSGVSFLIYGIGSLNSRRMNSEFIRWGYKNYRHLIGTFQLLGGSGLLIWLFFKPLIILSSSCLTLMMIIAVYVRFKIKDPFQMILPALFYTLINGLITYLFI